MHTPGNGASLCSQVSFVEGEAMPWAFSLTRKVIVRERISCLCESRTICLTKGDSGLSSVSVSLVYFRICEVQYSLEYR